MRVVSPDHWTDARKVERADARHDEPCAEDINIAEAVKERGIAADDFKAENVKPETIPETDITIQNGTQDS